MRRYFNYPSNHWLLITDHVKQPLFWFTNCANITAGQKKLVEREITEASKLSAKLLLSDQETKEITIDNVASHTGYPIYVRPFPLHQEFAFIEVNNNSFIVVHWEGTYKEIDTTFNYDAEYNYQLLSIPEKNELWTSILEDKNNNVKTKYFIKPDK